MLSDKDLKYVGEGGVAIVYESLSTGLIVKKLRDELKVKESIKHRFKREFDLTKSLSDLSGVIKVYDFDSLNYSYTMEKAESKLEYLINNTNIEESVKITIIRDILEIMKNVHNRNIIHRDLSPNNILLFGDKLKICDFGLGKDLDMFYSHRTMHTQSIGQYYYCAPEQFMQFKDGDKRSDVYSLGSIINFIMTKDPMNSKHFLRSPVEKAKNENPNMRYKDAGLLLEGIENSIMYYEDKENYKVIKSKINDNIYDEDIENFIYSLDGKKLCENIIKLKNMDLMVLKFIEEDEKRQIDIMDLLYTNYLYTCTNFKYYEKFAGIAYEVIYNNYAYVAQEISARILYDIAYDKNIFRIQSKVHKLVEHGIDPTIEELLEG